MTPSDLVLRPLISLGFCLLSLPLTAPAFSQSEVVKRGDFTRDGKPNVQAPSAIAIDWSTEKPLFEKNPDELRPVASLSKMMAVLVVQETCNLKPEELHVMSVENRVAAKGGDRSGLTTGWSYSHTDLMYSALMRSDNRAVPALGEACHLTPDQFGERMSAKARALGLNKTIFVEPTGLSPLNVSTAREVMVILKQVTRIPELARIMTTQKYLVVGSKNGKTKSHVIRNTDRFVMSGSLDVIGGKTGYTDLARYCLAVALQMPERGSVGVVVMGAEGKLTRFADVRRILKWLGKKDAVVATSAPIGSEVDEANGNSSSVKEAGLTPKPAADSGVSHNSPASSNVSNSSGDSDKTVN